MSTVADLPCLYSSNPGAVLRSSRLRLRKFRERSHEESSRLLLRVLPQYGSAPVIRAISCQVQCLINEPPRFPLFLLIAPVSYQSHAGFPRSACRSQKGSFSLSFVPLSVPPLQAHTIPHIRWNIQRKTNCYQISNMIPKKQPSKFIVLNLNWRLTS